MKKSIFDCLKSTLNDIKNILLKPTKFFKSVKNETDNKRSLIVYVVYAVVNFFILSLIALSLGSPNIFGLILLSGSVFVEILLIYLNSIFINISLGFLGTKNTTYKKTASVYFYTSFFNLLNYIPFVNFIGLVYRIFYLVPKGLSIKYNISHRKALIGSILPVVIILVIILLSIFIFSIGITGMEGIQGTPSQGTPGPMGLPIIYGYN